MPPIKVVKKKTPSGAATNEQPDKAKTDDTGKPAPLPVENPTPAAPVKVLPSADELLAWLRPHWKRAQLGTGDTWNPTLDPLRSHMLAKGHRPLAKPGDYYGTEALRTELASFRWAQEIFRELSNRAIRWLRSAESMWHRAYKRSATGPGGRLVSGPTGELLTFARWEQRNRVLADLAAGHFDPESSLTPPGPEPPRFDDPLGAAAAVFQAGAMIRALEAAAKDYPHLSSSPYPDALMGEVEAVEARVRTDLNFASGILASLSDCREWKPLRDFDPDTVEADSRQVERAFWDASSRAKDAALRADGMKLHALEGKNASMGLGERTQAGSWVISRRCWWEAISACEREHYWQHECQRHEQLQADIDACVDDPEQPTPARRAALDRKLFLEKQLHQTGKRMEDLADKMHGHDEPNAEVKNGTDN